LIVRPFLKSISRIIIDLPFGDGYEQSGWVGDGLSKHCPPHQRGTIRREAKDGNVIAVPSATQFVKENAERFRQRNRPRRRRGKPGFRMTSVACHSALGSAIANGLSPSALVNETRTAVGMAETVART
jgi:hypothetical protein